MRDEGGAQQGAGADPRAVVQGPGYRFSVLTSRLLRMEWSDRDVFVDRPTQVVAHRRFPVPDFTVRDDATSLEIRTEHLHLCFDKRAFSPGGLSVTLRTRAQDSHHTTWRHGVAPTVAREGAANLGGTTRTLDDVDGPVPLDPGLLATHGLAVVDDSDSLLMTADGWVEPRPGPGQDLYLFGHGRDYQAALRDYFHLTGPSPLLPRFALGNWWSRFHPYSADEYLALTDRFAAEGVPLAVAVLDMEWHVVDVDASLGSGWTGYTWNRELFPDPAAFLAALHERGLATALNVHPADGVRRHEAAYPAMARDLGVDPERGHEIAFDVAARDFVAAYLRHLHHPHEAMGVDLWWIDWQSGDSCRLPGLDPLWMLNHVHYRDAGRGGRRRPLILSRYAGLGGHRHPVGFSGDVVRSWASLAFQPYFTATAANVGYFWWSHDVGGHLGGSRDDELTARWVQFGAFSPINRLHSSRSEFNSREPWRHREPARRTIARFLRWRHRLVPYLYSAMWVSHTDGVAPLRPMYHAHPHRPEAYRVPNQYLLGPDLLVAPITTPADSATLLGAVTAWLPEGTWYDFFTGRRYTGGHELVLHRPLEQMPVLARAGAVVPLASDPLAPVGTAPEALTLRIFPGSGSTVLHEDAGTARPSVADRHDTRIDVRHVDTAVTVTVAPPTGPGVRTDRAVTIELPGVAAVRRATGRAGTRDVDVVVRPATPGRGVVVETGRVDLRDGLVVEVEGVTPDADDATARTFELVDRARIAYALKERAMTLVAERSGPSLLTALHALGLPGNLYGALLEVHAADEEAAARRPGAADG